MTPGRLRVAILQRRPMEDHHSIERVFSELRRALPPSIEATHVEMPFHSIGLVRRLGNLVFSAVRQGPVTHVTGDIQYVAMVLRRRTTILMVHDLQSISRLAGIRRAVYTLLWFRLPIRRCGYVTVGSDAVKEDLVRLLPSAASKVRVMDHPVSARFRPSERANIPGRPPVVLQVGTSPNKNVDRVVRAVAGLPVHLRIVGRLDPAHRKVLEDCDVEFSNVYDLSDDEMAEAYTASDVLVFVSMSEGFGLPIIEAQATARPVVTSMLSPMIEVAGGAAVYVDPFDVSSIRLAIQQVLDDEQLYEDLVRRGLENARRFAASGIGKRYADLYESVALESNRYRSTWLGRRLAVLRCCVAKSGRER